MSLPESFHQQLLQLGQFVQLQISSDGELLSVSNPANTPFKWDKNNRSAFRIEEHLLQPNQLRDMDTLFELAKQSSLPQIWQWGFEDHSLYSLQTCWLHQNGPVNPPQLTAIINTQPIQEQADHESKKYYFQAINFPGLLHNLSGSLGTVMGRAELLKRDIPGAENISEILKASYHLRDMIVNSSYKLDHEGIRKKVPISLDRFLKVELDFLKHQRPFKHHLTVDLPRELSVPQFNASYIKMSGILSEVMYFTKTIMNERADYNLSANGFYQSPRGGYSLQIVGPFQLKEIEKTTELHITREGRANADIANLDIPFLSTCAKGLDASISLTIHQNQLILVVELPISM